MAVYLLDSYDNLKKVICELAEDDSSEFIDYIPTAIQIAENRLYRVIDHDFSKLSTSLTTVDGVNTLTKPDDFRVNKNLYITVSDERKRLVMKSESFLVDYWPNAATKSEPKYYANRDDSTWVVAPTPNAAYPVTIEYEAQPVLLSDSNQTNIYTDKYPDLLLYASLSAAAEWMRDFDMKQEWESKLAEAIQSTNIEGVRERRDDNAHVYNPEGGLNTKG
jgi:hypothetical protein